MAFFNNEKSTIYKKGFIILSTIMILSIIATQAFDVTKFEIFFRGLWVISAFLNVTLIGTREVYAKGNKAGYLYYIMAIMFIYYIIYLYMQKQ